MMDINFYAKSLRSFIILSVMWYERLTKCYLLHTDPSEFRELGKTYQVTCFFFYQLWTTGASLNILLDPSNHDSQISPNEIHELGSWAKTEMMCYELEPWGLTPFLCKNGFFCALEEIFQQSIIVLTWCMSPMK